MNITIRGKIVLAPAARSGRVRCRRSEVVMSGAPLGTNDPMFDTPFVDVDEWRDEPVRHRYVHGGFEGTDTLFSMYFPPAERYEGRFFHPVMPVSGTEHGVGLGLLAGMGGSIEFAIDSGAY